MVTARYRENRQFAKRITERERQIKRLVALVEKAVLKYGVEINRVSGSSHTKVKSKLEIGDYRILTTFGMTMMGGNEIEILRLGTEEHRDRQIFDIYWQAGLDDCKVKRWEERTEWYNVITALLSNHKQIAQLQKESGVGPVTKRESKRRGNLAAEIGRLTDTANRLGLSDLD